MLIFAAISREFAGLSEDALKRHKEGHIPKLLLKSQDAKESLQADNTFSEYQKAKARIEALQSRTYDLLAKAEDAEDHRACKGYIHECIGIEAELREQRNSWQSWKASLRPAPSHSSAGEHLRQPGMGGGG